MIEALGRGVADPRRKRAEMRGLADRGISGVWSYPGFVLILALVAPPHWFEQHRIPLYLLGAVSAACSATRALLIWPWIRWIDDVPNRWRALWAASLVPAALAWGLFFAWSFKSGGEIQTIVAISLGGLCAGAMINAVPSWPLMVSFELAALLPSAIAAIVRSTRVDLGLAVLILLFLAFLLIQGRHVNRDFWESYDLRLSLLEHTRQMEEAVRLAEQRQAAAEESEQRYRIIFESSPLPMWLCDVEARRFVAVNDQAVRKYGYSSEEFLTMPASGIEVSEDFPGQAPAAASPMARSRHRRKDGSIMDVEVTSYPIEWSGRTALLILSNDISGRVHAEREKGAMEIQLSHAQKLESIGQLAAGIAHEINTPTQYIGDNLHFLKDAFNDIRTVMETQQRILPLMEGDPTLRRPAAEIRQAMDAADVGYLMDEVPRALEQAIDGVGRVSTLIRALKEFSHPGTKEKSPADLNSAIQSTISIARNEWKYVAKVETDLDPGLPMIPCIVSDFNQVMLNLIVNAAHAIGAVRRAIGDLGLITISTRANGDYVEIRVQDTGTGIPAPIRDRIFDPFFTTKDVGKGTGQGLSIARSVVVEKHGGTLSFETETGKGTTFVVRLPLDRATVTPTPELQPLAAARTGR